MGCCGHLFFHENGIVDEATGVAYSGAKVATDISKDWLGTFGGILAILGIVAAPITSGDTALRSARLIVADFFHVEQRSIRRRLFICIPIFLVTIALLLYSFGDAEGFKIIWRYFAWCNQALSVFTLWAITVWLVHEKKNYWVTLIPALFMTAVCSTYILIAPEGLALSESISYPLGAVCVLIAIIWFAVWYKKEKNVFNFYYILWSKDSRVLLLLIKDDMSSHIVSCGKTFFFISTRLF